MIVVVGAGLAGLVCAYQLMQNGYKVVLLEAQGAPGGRVRTDVSAEGFRFDRGFQVLFSSYPALRRHAPLGSLQPCYFTSGVQVVANDRTMTFGHPAFDPAGALRTVASSAIGLRDVLSLMSITSRSVALGDRTLPANGRSARETLRAAGATDSFVTHVMEPLFGGISLDRSLSSDGTFLAFVLRSLAFGRAFLPAYGVQRLADVLASRLPPNAIRCGVLVRELVRDGDDVVAVRTADETIPCRAVVIATDAPTAGGLTGLSVPLQGRSCTTAYFQSRKPLVAGKRLVLNASGTLVNQVIQLSNVAPTYAPAGRHLLAAVALQEVRGSEDTVMASMRHDLDLWLPTARGFPLEPLRLVRVSFAQFAQPPGTYAHLPRSRTSVSNLFLAGEYLHSSSVQGAMRSGELAATEVAQRIPRPD